MRPRLPNSSNFGRLVLHNSNIKPPPVIIIHIFRAGVWRRKVPIPSMYRSFLSIFERQYIENSLLTINLSFEYIFNGCGPIIRTHSIFFLVASATIHISNKYLYFQVLWVIKFDGFHGPRYYINSS